MEKLAFILAVASLSVAQQQYVRDPKEAAILSEKRYLSNNGQFGSAYTQEDGVQFTEESDQDGNRRGAYSYIDPNGQRRTVTYTAGKNGFQASGDHLPVAPPAPAPVAPQAPAAPQGPAAAAPARQYSVSDNTEEGQYHPIYDDVDYWERQSKSRPASPAPQQWSAPSAPAAPAPQQWNAPAAPAPQQWNAPATRSFSAPAPQEWSAPAAPAPRSWSAPAAAPAPQQWSAPAPQQWSAPAAAPAPQQWSAPAPRSWSAPSPAPAGPQIWETNNIASTEAPHRFFPPGKLDLNRSPDGFSYSFSKS